MSIGDPAPVTLAVREVAVIRTAADRLTPALFLALAIGTIAIVGYRAWWSLAFVAFAGAVALTERGRAQSGEVIGTATALAVPPALGIVSLSLVSVSQLASIPCGSHPCPSGPLVLLAGVAVAIAAAVALARSVSYLRRRGSRQPLLPAINALFLCLFAAEMILGAGRGNSLVEFGAVAAAAGMLPLALDRSGLLRVALVAQLADLGTFALVWQAGRGEQNPLARWIFDALFLGANGSSSWEAPVVTGLILIVAKLALIGFLLRAASHLGRYKRVVLVVAGAAGMVGTASNVLAFPFIP